MYKNQEPSHIFLTVESLYKDIKVVLSGKVGHLASSAILNWDIQVAKRKEKTTCVMGPLEKLAEQAMVLDGQAMVAIWYTRVMELLQFLNSNMKEKKDHCPQRLVQEANDHAVFDKPLRKAQGQEGSSAYKRIYWLGPKESKQVAKHRCNCDISNLIPPVYSLPQLLALLWL